jgi:hypothetical protein
MIKKIENMNYLNMYLLQITTNNNSNNSNKPIMSDYDDDMYCVGEHSVNTKSSNKPINKTECIKSKIFNIKKIRVNYQKQED